jgi:hypothetical protein
MKVLKADDRQNSKEDLRRVGATGPLAPQTFPIQ